MAMSIEVIHFSDVRYPRCFAEKLGDTSPDPITVLGNLDLLSLPKTALFCSARCPGSAILRAYDQAARWREANRCVISGFHSPVEQECLRILLRGTSPVIICPARSLPKRIPPSWHAPLAAGHMLVLSFFVPPQSRVTAQLAKARNDYVACLADEVWFPHASDGGKLQKSMIACTTSSPDSHT
jgi:predicted Rossmann fold nucleotide-binding protein DprA/Smf involved in DNA uptake